MKSRWSIFYKKPVGSNEDQWTIENNNDEMFRWNSWSVFKINKNVSWHELKHKHGFESPWFKIFCGTNTKEPLGLRKNNRCKLPWSVQIFLSSCFNVDSCKVCIREYFAVMNNVKCNETKPGIYIFEFLCFVNNGS